MWRLTIRVSRKPTRTRAANSSRFASHASRLGGALRYRRLCCSKSFCWLDLYCQRPGGGMADAEDLKSSGDFSSCGFDSHPGHHSSSSRFSLRCDAPNFLAVLRFQRFFGCAQFCAHLRWLLRAANWIGFRAWLMLEHPSHCLCVKSGVK
jgi:hypothetical protein